MNGLDIQFGIPPSPLGSLPTSDGFQVDWPAYLILEADGTPTLTGDNVPMVSLYLDLELAVASLKDGQRVVSVDKGDLVAALRIAAASGSADLLTFNPGHEPVLAGRPIDDVIATLAR
jgi:hypothetical protein